MHILENKSKLIAQDSSIGHQRRKSNLNLKEAEKKEITKVIAEIKEIENKKTTGKKSTKLKLIL